MCVALPGTVIEKKNGYAIVDLSGNRVKARTGFVDVEVGDPVLVHAGCVLQKLSKNESDDLTELMKEVGAF